MSRHPDAPDMKLEEAYYFTHDKLNFCGCDNPELALKLVGLVLTVIEYKHEGQQPYENISRWMNRLLPGDGLQLFVLYQLDRAGLTEHGSSVGSSWLTSTGTSFLRALRTYGVDDITDDEVVFASTEL